MKERKNILILFILVIFGVLSPVMGQEMALNQDSLEYELQRQKVNKLLDDRLGKFAQYDESLRKKTGIFGFKTKRDMQTSLNILLQIIETDQVIFRETKNLLNYKDQMLSFESFEKEKVQQLANDYDQRINAYIKTISKLQQELENLKTNQTKLERKTVLYSSLTFLFLTLLIGLLMYIFLKKQKTTKL